MVRSVSRSYCGSELSDADVYSPYSFYGSEAGTDVAQGDFHDGWNGHQVMCIILLYKISLKFIACPTGWPFKKIFTVIYHLHV